MASPLDLLPPDASPLLALALAAGVGVGAGLLAWAALGVAARLAGRTRSTVDDDLLRRLSLPIALMLAVVAAGATLAVAPDGLPATALLAVRHALVALFVVAAAWGLVRALRVLFEAAGRRRRRLLPATHIGGRLAAVVLYTAAFLTILSEYGISVTPVLTGLGIAGLAVALALQDTLANFFAGIWIQTGRPLRPGHFVRLEQEKLDGYVEEVGWRATHIRTLGGNTVVIPNAKLAQAVVTDHNLPTPATAVVMEFLVGQEEDPAKVIAILVEEAKQAAEGNPAFAPGSEPFAQFSGIEEYALKFSLILRVTEFVQQFQAQHDVRMRVLARLRKEGIRIPYPTRRNLQEQVASPKAHGALGAPGGVGRKARRPRPPREGREGAQPAARDPRVREAEQAKSDIAALQAKKAAEQAEAGKAPPAAAGEPAPGGEGERAEGKGKDGKDGERESAKKGRAAQAAAAAAAAAAAGGEAGAGAAAAGGAPQGEP